MNHIILASHGHMAKGIKDTLNMIIGDAGEVKAFSSYRDEDENIREAVEREVKNNYETKDIYILTDIFGGSVNNELLALLKQYPDINMISGMNLPLVISIATCDDISEEMLEEFIKESRESIVNCNNLLKNLNNEGGEGL